MTVELQLLPDGSAELPREARDHGVLWNALKGASKYDRDVERVVTREAVYLRLDGKMGDWQQQRLDALANALTNSVNGLKAHPDGWQEV